jgi:hydroxymethylpyrimidine/phosphomethylpyrimidine kinase
MAKKICVLTIAGSDSGSGAGIQSDLKTFKNHGLYGVNVITSVTAQNTKGVQSSYELSAGIIDEQLKSIFGDFNVKAVKTGMLSSAKVIDIVAKHLKRKKIKLVIDPVILSKNGFALLNKEGVKQLKTKLIPLAFAITPNIPEAEELTGIEISSIDDLETAAVILQELGAKNVVIKGGHMKISTGLPKGTDILFDGKKFYMFNSEYINTKNTHGIGCTFSASITSNLALGKSLIESIAQAKNYISKALKKTVKIGYGFSSVEQ